MYMYAYMYIYMHKCIYLYTYAYICIHAYTHTWVSSDHQDPHSQHPVRQVQQTLRLCVYVHLCMCVCACVCVYMRLYVCVPGSIRTANTLSRHVSLLPPLEASC